MIKRFWVNDLNGNPEWKFDFHLHPDINVFTGKNGAGKTTVLKLLWYLISGNIERVFPEISFSSAGVEGDGYSLKIKMKNPTAANVEWEINGKKQSELVNTRVGLIEDQATLRIDKEIATATGSSVFFPTFRRIEGGFSLSGRPRMRARRGNLLQEGMNELAEDLSYENHCFVSSIATDDIESLLTGRLAKNSENTNALHADLCTFIEGVIRGEWDQIESDTVEATLSKANSIMRDIKSKVHQIETERNALFRPFTVLSDLIKELMQHKGLVVKDIFTFGDAAAAIDSGHLSAGEKQMFSFLCYNAFKRKSAIFIDEPEISLHVDWQRILFPKLMEQASDNQFIISTHSPFIYGKYSDREIILHADKGVTNE